MTPPRSKRPRALVWMAAGTNCDGETVRALELAGASPKRVHIQSLIERPEQIFEYDLAVLPGGFTYGDDVAAGKVLAVQLRHYLEEPLQKFASSGRPILGICNGFQVLVKAGLLPAIDRTRKGQELTLATNDNGRFVCRWVCLESRSEISIFSRPGERLEMPIAHAEGKIVADPQVVRDLTLAQQIAYVYSDGVNPNGSVADIAGICDPSGHVLGLMPHPERNVSWHHHPRWLRRSSGGENPWHEREGDGLSLFRNMVACCRERNS